MTIPASRWSATTTVVFLAALPVSGSEPCTVCPNPVDRITLPDKQVELTGFGVFSCDTLQLLAPTVLDTADEACDLLHSFSSICGCPVRGVSCSLCANGSSPTAPSLQVETSLFPDEPISCELLEAYLRSVAEDSEECVDGIMVASECGCPSVVEGGQRGMDPTVSPQDAISEAPPQGTDGETGKGAAPCTMCWDQSAVQFPDKDITYILAEYPDTAYLVEGLDVNVTCAFAEVIVGGSVPDSAGDECFLVQFLLGGICGCNPVNNHCDLCPNDEGVPLPDKPFVGTGAYIGFTPSCGDVDLLSTQLPASNYACFGAQLVSYTCGCDGGQRQYFGADSEGKRAALAWIPRVTGFMSFIGSSLIILDVLRARSKNRNKKVSIFHQLILIMSLFDISSSICWMFSTAPIPVYIDGSPSTIYGARGNDATCTAQGFFFQLGYMGSIFYNLVLSFYYLLVIVYAFKEPKLQKIRVWFHIPPLIVALGLAFAGIPFYEQTQLACAIPPRDPNASMVLPLVFGIVPVSTVIFLASLSMLIIYLAVRKQSRAANRWRFENSAESSSGRGSGSILASIKDSLVGLRDSLQGSRGSNCTAEARLRPSVTRTNNRMERAVVWQSVFYLGAFFVSWPIYLVAQLRHTTTSYTFWAMVVTLTPLQGFLNFCVYARPRVFQHLAKKKREREAVQRNAGVIADSACTIITDELGHFHPHMGGVQDDQLSAPRDPPLANEATGEENNI